MAVVACSPPPVAEEQAPLAAEFRSSRVDLALADASQVVQTRGFTDRGDEWRGFLLEQAADVHELRMRSGTCYVVLAAGTSALRELDLRLFDSEGSDIAQDDARGAAAALRFCPPQSGTYYVAARASAGTGLFGARTFRGPAGLEIRMDDLFRGEPR